MTRLTTVTVGTLPAGWPTPDTTGVPAGTTLTTWGGGTVLGPGTYDSLRFSAEMDLSPLVNSANPVTFTKCLFEGGLNNWSVSGGKRFAATDCSFGSAAAPVANTSGFAVGAQSFSLLRCGVYGSDGVRWSNIGWQIGDPRDSFRDCYIRATGQFPDHADGIQCVDSDAPLDIVHCTIELRSTNSTACVYWESGTRDVLIDGCLIVADDAPFGLKIVSGSGHVVRNTVFAGLSRGNHNQDIGCPLMAAWSNNRLATIGAGFSSYAVQFGALVPCS